MMAYGPLGRILYKFYFKAFTLLLATSEYRLIAAGSWLTREPRGGLCQRDKDTIRGLFGVRKEIPSGLAVFSGFHSHLRNLPGSSIADVREEKNNEQESA